MVVGDFLGKILMQKMICQELYLKQMKLKIEPLAPKIRSVQVLLN